MLNLNCKICGGELDIDIRLDAVVCDHCGGRQPLEATNVATVVDPAKLPKQMIRQYRQAYQMLTTAQTAEEYGEAAKMLEQMAGFGQSEALAQQARTKEAECRRTLWKQQEENRKKREEAQHKEKKTGVMKRIRFWLILICCAAVLILIKVIPEWMHDVKSIQIELVDVWGQSDDRYHYVMFDYQIDNNTGATIDYMEITTYFNDDTGKNLGTVTSSFGESSGRMVLNLQPGESVIKENHLSEYKNSKVSEFFATLYREGADDFEITYEITYVKWSDGHTYSR